MCGKIFKVGMGWGVNDEGMVVYRGDIKKGEGLIGLLNGLIKLDPGRYGWESISMDELGGLMFFVDTESEDVDDEVEGMDWRDKESLEVILEEFMNDVGRTEDSGTFYYMGCIWERDDTHYWKV